MIPVPAENLTRMIWKRGSFAPTSVTDISERQNTSRVLLFDAVVEPDQSE